MKRRFLLSALFFTCVVVLFFAGDVRAGSIVMQVRMTLAVVSDRIDVRITVANDGTEPARDVRAVLHVFGRTRESGTERLLNVRQSRSFDFQVPVPQGKQGRFPVTGEILYHDANLHPFSAVSCDTFNLSKKTKRDFIAAVPDLDLAGIGRLPVLLRNRSPNSRSGIATLYLPHGIATPAKQQYFDIGPGGKQTIDFQLTDRYDIGGADYHAFCVIEYEENNFHHTEIARSRIRVSRFQNWFQKTRWHWLSLMVPLFLGWVILLVFSFFNRREDIAEDSE